MKTEQFKTSDIQIAAFLVARGHNVLAVDTEGDTSHGVFLFPFDARDEVDEFFRDGKVSAKRFASAIRELKARIRHVTR